MNLATEAEARDAMNRVAVEAADEARKRRELLRSCRETDRGVASTILREPRLINRGDQPCLRDVP